MFLVHGIGSYFILPNKHVNRFSKDAYRYSICVLKYLHMTTIKTLDLCVWSNIKLIFVLGRISVNKFHLKSTTFLLFGRFIGHVVLTPQINPMHYLIFTYPETQAFIL